MTNKSRHVLPLPPPSPDQTDLHKRLQGSWLTAVQRCCFLFKVPVIRQLGVESLWTQPLPLRSLSLPSNWDIYQLCPIWRAGEREETEWRRMRERKTGRGREALRQVICGHDDTLCVSGACTLLWYKEKQHSIEHKTNWEYNNSHTCTQMYILSNKLTQSQL